MKILSVLMPTTPDRVDMFTPLYNELQRQKTYMNTFHSTLGEIEILIDSSKAFLEGGLSIGKKRELLVNRATGRYLCFLDSDDNIPGIYLETIVRACHYGPDIITFNALARLKEFWTVVHMGLSFPNDEASPDDYVRRAPSIVCPVKSEIAKSVPFEDINWGEDYKWMKQVADRCYLEKSIPMILYEYRHGAHSESDQIIKAGYK